MSDYLKPCPLCAQSDRIEGFVWGASPTYSISCGHCNLMISDLVEQASEVKKRWNTRAADQSLEDK